MTTAGRHPTHGKLSGRAAFAALGAACALVPSLAMWGFTVDDALISVRYAHHLAIGAGYRFDAHGASTDGVTPLPWPWLLAPLAGGDAMATLVRAKVLGVISWTLGGALLGGRVGTMVEGSDRRRVVLALAALVVMGLAFPIGAWAASGMETGVATAIATGAAVAMAAGRPRLAAALAGIVATLRPEMVVWALAVGAGVGAWAGAGLAAAPFVVCAVVRMAVWGRAAPLSVMAKPSDLSHGAVYALAAALVVLTPIIAATPIAIATKGGREARVLALAFMAHVLAVIAAGGDWMPFARLMVPVAPSLVIVFVAVTPVVRPAWSAARLAAAAVLGALLAVRAAPAGLRVHADRADLVARARPVLAGAEVVAGLDVGWIGASTDARIVDLAGLTDPSIAVLGGGHTSKRVDASMLLDRGVDIVIVYSEPRVVEARLVGSELFSTRFEPREVLPVGSRGAFYTVYRRRKS